MMKRIFSLRPVRNLPPNALPRSPQTGFTVVEVMMSLILLAIGATLSLPSYREMVEKRQLTHGAEQIMAFVNSAQAEAMKQNQLLTVSYAREDDDDWCVGATLGADACDCAELVATEADYCAIDAAPWRITNEHAGDTELVKSLDGDGAYTIDPVRGIFVDLDDALVVEMRSDSEDYRLDLLVSSTGQVNLCSRDATHAVPGYAVCPDEDDEG